jgi:hypothetical protein
VVELEEGVELGAEVVVEEGVAAELDAEESLVDEAAGLSEDFLESDFESDLESPDLDEESDDLESELESLELVVLGA